MAYKPMFHQVTVRTESFGSHDAFTTGSVTPEMQEALKARAKAVFIARHASDMDSEGNVLGVGGALELYDRQFKA
jgi:hypothetical protein